MEETGEKRQFSGYVLRIELIGFPDRSAVGMNDTTRVVQLASRLSVEQPKDGVIYTGWSYLQKKELFTEYVDIYNPIIIMYALSVY